MPGPMGNNREHLSPKGKGYRPRPTGEEIRLAKERTKREEAESRSQEERPKKAAELQRQQEAEETLREEASDEAAEKEKTTAVGDGAPPPGVKLLGEEPLTQGAFRRFPADDLMFDAATVKYIADCRGREPPADGPRVAGEEFRRKYMEAFGVLPPRDGQPTGLTQDATPGGRPTVTPGGSRKNPAPSQAIRPLRVNYLVVTVEIALGGADSARQGGLRRNTVLAVVAGCRALVP